MKTEINLRTREFTITREFYWPRILITLAVIGFLALFVGGTFFVYFYQLQLGVENSFLEQEKKSLLARIAPIEEMEAKISDLERREKLAGLLAEDRCSWSARFRTIRRIAGDHDIGVSSLIASGEDRVRITGQGASMRSISLFMQALAADEGSRAAVYKYITYGGEKFNCEIELILAGGGER